MPAKKISLPPAPPQNRRSQLIGIGAGLLAASLLILLVRPLPFGLDNTGALLSGGAIGGVLGSLDEMARAGQVLTRRENRWLNIAASVGVLGAAVLLLIWVIGLF